MRSGLTVSWSRGEADNKARRRGSRRGRSGGRVSSLWVGAWAKCLDSQYQVVWGVGMRGGHGGVISPRAPTQSFWQPKPVADGRMKHGRCQVLICFFGVSR